MRVGIGSDYHFNGLPAHGFVVELLHHLACGHVPDGDAAIAGTIKFLSVGAEGDAAAAVLAGEAEGDFAGAVVPGDDVSGGG